MDFVLYYHENLGGRRDGHVLDHYIINRHDEAFTFLFFTIRISLYLYVCCKNLKNR